MTLILCLVKDGWTPLHIACYNGHDKVVQVLLDHSQVDIPDQVSDISYIHAKLCNTREVNEATLVTQEINKNDVCILSLFTYDFNYGISIQHINL